MSYDFFSERNKRLNKRGFVGSFDYIYPEKHKAIYQIYVEMLKEWDQRISQNSNIRGLFINGTFGTGKSSLLALLADALITHGKRVAYTTAENYIKAKKQKEYDYMDYLAGVDILFFDDLGWGVSFESEINSIVEIIRDRYNQNKPCIVGSNLNIKALAESENQKSFSVQYRQLLSYFNDEQKYKHVLINIDSIRDTNAINPERPDLSGTILNHLPKIEGL